MVTSPHLVSDYLEDLPGKLLDRAGVVETFVAGKPGIYALYRNGSLYYVGLATDLKARLKQHQKDRHSGEWDRFSVYLTTSDNHLKDLESLLLRVTKKPNGNRQNGKFQGARNQNAEIKRRYKSKQAEEFNEDFNLSAKKSNKKGPATKNESPTRSGPFALRGYHKGNTVKALLKKDGSVRIGTENHTSLSSAAMAVTGHPTNGRWFWHIKRSKGWVRIKLA
ncbi:GIY-YIG nuclease family protein [Geothrix rubra]|uniref:GIY-YIG nuclease family protein n=1 Tax=Geothrix rubra TaxID=2927977 RepID=UPI002555F357|nr:GIY-YIG nuclease family protein [Geothrix rubra]